MRKETFNHMMNYFKNSYSVLLSDERIKTYWEVLKKYPDKYGKRVVFMCAEKYEFFPKISQIVEMIKYCEEDDIASYKANTRKIKGPSTVKIGKRWIRQTLALLSCKNWSKIYYGKLYTEDELIEMVKNGGGYIRDIEEISKKKEGTIK